MLCIYGKINGSACDHRGANFNHRGASFDRRNASFDRQDASLTVGMQNAPAYIYELCVN